MFQFSGLPALYYFIHITLHSFYSVRVSPFGNLRIVTYLPFPAAYRSLSRPSSAPDAKASSLCSCSLDLLLFGLALLFGLLYEYQSVKDFFIPTKLFYPFRKNLFYRISLFLLILFIIVQFSMCNCQTFSSDHGGDEESRTPDPLLARQVLSQLSYTPMSMVGLSGLEPPTSRLSGVCSNLLSYKPLFTYLLRFTHSSSTLAASSATQN